MRRKYWINFWRNFGNTYNLCWTEGAEMPGKSWERITRKEAEEKAREERRRRKYDQSFSGFADAYICKYGFQISPVYTGNEIIVDPEDCVPGAYFD